VLQRKPGETPCLPRDQGLCRRYRSRLTVRQEPRASCIRLPTATAVPWYGVSEGTSS
jgi:hypothetical protein